MWIDYETSFADHPSLTVSLLHRGGYLWNLERRYWMVAYPDDTDPVSTYAVEITRGERRYIEAHHDLVRIVISAGALADAWPVCAGLVSFPALYSDEIRLDDIRPQDMEGPVPPGRIVMAKTATPVFRDGKKWVGAVAIDPVCYFQALSRNGVTVYTATRWADDTTSCNCPGWGNRRACTHTKRVEIMTTSVLLMSPPSMPSIQNGGSRSGRPVQLRKKTD